MYICMYIYIYIYNIYIYIYIYDIYRQIDRQIDRYKGISSFLGFRAKKVMTVTKKRGLKEQFTVYSQHCNQIIRCHISL